MVSKNITHKFREKNTKFIKYQNIWNNKSLHNSLRKEKGAKKKKKQKLSIKITNKSKAKYKKAKLFKPDVMRGSASSINKNWHKQRHLQDTTPNVTKKKTNKQTNKQTYPVYFDNGYSL